MHGLDVEGLLAVPVLLVALGRLGDEAGRPDLAELTALEGGHAVVARVPIDVVDDGGRRVGVDHGDGHAAAVVAVGDGASHTVGGAELLGRVAAHRVGLHGAVGGGRSGRELLVPEERPRLAVAIAGRRRRDDATAERVDDRLTEPDDAGHDGASEAGMVGAEAGARSATPRTR